MAVADFVIPSNLEDLLDTEDGKFSVSEVYAVQDLRHKVPDVLDDAYRVGCDHIITNFDVMFSVLRCFENLDLKTRRDAWDCIAQGLKKLVSDLDYLKPNVEDGDGEADEDRQCVNRNLVKMYVYLSCTLGEMLENSCRSKDAVAKVAKQTKAKKAPVANDDVWEGWQTERAKLISTLHDLLSYPLRLLFNPPVVVQEIPGLIGGLVYLILKDPAISHQKNNTLRLKLFEVIGILITDYAADMNCVFNLVQGIQNFEHFGPIVSEGLTHLVKTKGLRRAKMFAKNVVHEIARVEPHELSQDQKASKYFYTFFTLFSREVPDAFVANLNELCEHLDGEAYNMRLAVLTAFKEAVKSMAGKELTEDEAATREEYFAHMEDHTRDTTSYVRKDVLNMFFDLASPRIIDKDQIYALVTAGAPFHEPIETFIPIAKHKHILSLCCERLLDRSSSVRKAAIGLLRNLALFSPFHGQTLATQNLTEKLEKMEKDLEDAEKQWAADKNRVLQQDNVEAAVAVEGLVPSAGDAWLRIIRNVMDIFSHPSYKESSRVSKSFGRAEEGPLETPGKRRPRRPNAPNVEDTASQFSQAAHYEGFGEEHQIAVGKMLLEGEYIDACELLSELYIKFPNDEFFHVPVDPSKFPSVPEGDDDENTISDRGMKLVFIAQKVFLQCYESLVTNVQLKLPTASAVSQLTDAEKEASEKIRRLMRKGQAPSEVLRRRRQVEYLRDAKNHVKLMKDCMGKLCLLLKSSTASDVIESIKFFTETYCLNLEGTLESIRKMLNLVWSKDQSIVDAVRSAYETIYLSIPLAPNSDPMYAQRKRNVDIVRNLSTIVMDASVGEVQAFESLVESFLKSNAIDSNVISILWDRFTGKIPGTSESESRCALLLLGMTVSAAPAVLRRNVDVLVDFGLKKAMVETPEGIKTDFGLARDALHILLKLASHSRKNEAKVKGDPKEGKGEKGVVADGESEPGTACNKKFKCDHDDPMIQAAADLLCLGVFSGEDEMFAPMAQNAVDLIFSMTLHPGQLCGKIAQRMYRCFVVSGKPELGTEEEVERMTSRCSLSGEIRSVLLLARTVTVVGHMALRMAEYLEVEIAAELKRREAVQESRKSSGPGKGGRSVRKDGPTPLQRKRRSLALLASMTKMRRQSRNGPALYEYNKGLQSVAEVDLDEELGLAGAAAEDVVAERLRKMSDDKIVRGDGILARFAPLIVNICRDPRKFPHQELRSAAILALGKCMLVSRPFCEEHLNLFFTILERSEDDSTRANCIVIAADLSVRFPNLLDPWTLHMYSRLSDPSLLVRSNALTVLTQLILNDMVKVKGQISQVARCLVDDNAEISQCAHQFFAELAKKKNTLYNALPDLISCLSDPEQNVAKDEFRVILKKVLGLVEKDKQMEQLVDKLCCRLRLVDTPRQWEDLSYCLMLLHYNEKALKKLVEHFSAFHGKLQEDEVHNALLSVINKARSNAKEIGKSVVEELAELTKEEREKSVEARGALGRAGGMRGGKKGGAKQKEIKSVLRSNKPKRLMRMSLQPDDDDSDGDGEAASDRPANGRARRARDGAGEEEEGGEEEEEEQEAGSDGEDGGAGEEIKQEHQVPDKRGRRGRHAGAEADEAGADSGDDRGHPRSRRRVGVQAAQERVRKDDDAAAAKAGRTGRPSASDPSPPKKSKPAPKDDKENRGGTERRPKRGVVAEKRSSRANRK